MEHTIYVELQALNSFTLVKHLLNLAAEYLK